MARFTPIYGEFISRMSEVELLRKKAAALERSRKSLKQGDEISALCRGAVVLLSSHIEAYVKELGEHTLDAIFSNAVCRSKLAPQFFYHVSKQRIENVRNGSKAEKIAKNVRAIVVQDAAMWGNKGQLPARIPSQEFNDGFSNPKFDKVKAYFGRFGYTNFRNDYFQKLGRDAQTSITNLDQIVDTRNSIAHGNVTATKTPSEVQGMVETGKVFCRATDQIFSDWCQSEICAIRK